jgi:redox-sensitive bicupin YhaK (pirin superfamily)
MNAINTALACSNGFTPDEVVFVSEPVSGDDLTVGAGFKAQSFRARDIGEAMDPLVMVDHYLMTESTFGVHPHAGMSAVSLLFEDSEGLFHNRDSLGNDFDLQPGDLYWLSAGSGAVHDESPRANARIHGLQVFVNVPQTQRFESPSSLLVRSADMPVIKDRDYRVKVALGNSNGVCGAASPSIQMTILDGTVQPGGHFSHESVDNRGIWVQAVEGSLHVVVGETARHLAPGQAIAVKTGRRTEISIGNPSRESVHFALFDGAQIAETYVQDGPFVMGSEEQIADIKAAYEAGQLGSIADNH